MEHTCVHRSRPAILSLKASPFARPFAELVTEAGTLF